MSTAPTIAAQQEPMLPVIAPDGTSGSIPQSQIPGALKAGGKLGVRMTAPDGSQGIIPFDQQDAAQKAGAKWDVHPENDAVKQYMTPKPPGWLSRTASVAAEPFVAAYHGVTDPPQDVNEHIAYGQGGEAGVAGLVAYRAAKKIVDMHKALANAKPGPAFHQALWDFQNAAISHLLGNQYDATMHAVSAALSVGGAAEPLAQAPIERGREWSEGAASGGDMTKPVGHLASDLAIAATTAGAGRAAEGLLGVGKSAIETAQNLKQAALPTAELGGEEFASRPILRAGPNQAAGTKAVQNIANDTTKAAGATPTKATSLREVFDEPAKAIETNSKALYRQMDDATGGRFQPNADKLENVRTKIRNSEGLDPDADDKLLAQKTRLEWQQEKMFDEAEANGVPRNTVENARALWRQKSALEDVSDIFKKKASVSGANPDLVVPGVKGVPEEAYNFKSIAKDLNSMDPQRLKLALGDDGARQLVTAMNLAAKDPLAASKAASAVRLLLQSAGAGKLTHLLP
jgi:hypothetical protein